MTELRIEAYEIPGADVGPENPLPMFRAEAEDRVVNVADGLPEEDRRYLGWRIGQRVLPHRMQDSYTRDRRLRSFKCIVLENDVLKATFVPELGGRLVSLFHKQKDRELLDCNPVFQPANLALRNAWFSGGIEWNTSHFGHYYLTCSPVFATRVDGPDGRPTLRIYEWDRVKCFPWQIDFSLPPGSDFLFSHVRLVNPHETELPMYWWTNMAVPEREGTRTLAPADSAIHEAEPGKLGVASLPILDSVDATYSTNSRFAREFFFRIPEPGRHWIASLDASGSGFVQASTPRLRGRKMFVWGAGPGGQRWQEFLSQPGSAYLEIQAGLARTQLECVPMPPNCEWTWTEAFGLLEAEPAKVHSADWSEARLAAAQALDERLPESLVDSVHRELEQVSHLEPAEVLSSGSGWGALERRRLAADGADDRMPPQLLFPDFTLGPDQQPWLELLEHGHFPQRDPEQDPGQFMVQPGFRKLLEKAAEASSDHWLAWLHVGVMRMETHDTRGAVEAWKRSVSRQRTGWALRNLAIVERRAHNADAACDLLRQAWETGPQVAALAVECVEALVQAERYEDACAFVAGLPDDISRHERVMLLNARAALQLGRWRDVEPLLEHDFACIREGEVSLTDLWFAMHEQRIAEQENAPIDDVLRERVRLDCPPPHRIDFRTQA